jgi:hypothetical protein
MGVEGDRWQPASVVNKTSDVTLLVLDGIYGGLSAIGPGKDSQYVCWSIDAFGCYRNRAPVLVTFGGKASSWWKIPDGTNCEIVESPFGYVINRTYRGLFTLLLGKTLETINPSDKPWPAISPATIEAALCGFNTGVAVPGFCPK